MSVSPRSAVGATGWAPWRNRRLTKHRDKAGKKNPGAVAPIRATCLRLRPPRLSKIFASFPFEVGLLGPGDGVSRGGASWRGNKAGWASVVGGFGQDLMTAGSQGNCQLLRFRVKSGPA